MPPTLFKNDESRCDFANVEKLGKFTVRERVRSSQIAKISDVENTKLPRACHYSSASTVNPATRLFTIQRIVFFCTKLQVVGIYAARIADAFVKHAQIWRDRSDVENIGSNMRSKQPSERLASPELSVPKQMSRSNPRPAFIVSSLFNLLPKAFRKLFTKTLFGEILQSNVEHKSVVHEDEADGSLRPFSGLFVLRGGAEDVSIPRRKAPSKHDASFPIGTLDVPHLKLEAEPQGTYRSHVRSLASMGLLAPRGIFIMPQIVLRER